MLSMQWQVSRKYFKNAPVDPHHFIADQTAGGGALTSVDSGEDGGVLIAFSMAFMALSPE